jgi:tetratricopeptide (TPR) repeat protein
MKTTLILGLAVGVALAGVLRADSPATQAGTTTMVVAKNDSPKALVAGEKMLANAQYADAAAYFEGIGVQVRAHGRKTREALRLTDLATAMLMTGRYSEAEATSTKALDLNMGLQQAWYVMGMAQEDQHEHDSAVSTFTMGIVAVQSAGKDASTLEANRTLLQAEAQKPQGSTQVSAATGY